MIKRLEVLGSVLSARNKKRQTIWIGQRVAVYWEEYELYYYGIIRRLTNNNAQVAYDDGNNHVHPLDEIVPVVQWEDNEYGWEEEDLNLLKRNTNPAEMCNKNTGHVHFGKQVVRGLWYYINAVVFSGKMREPKLELDRRALKRFGAYWWPSAKKGPHGTIGLSNLIVTSAKLLNTLAHEMIHQYNRTVEAENPHIKAELLKDGHGQVFLKWIPVIQEKLNTKVSVTDPLDTKTELVPNPNGGSKTRYIVVLRAGKFTIADIRDKKPTQDLPQVYYGGYYASIEEAWAAFKAFRTTDIAGLQNWKHVKSFLSKKNSEELWQMEFYASEDLNVKTHAKLLKVGGNFPHMASNFYHFIKEHGRLIATITNEESQWHGD